MDLHATTCAHPPRVMKDLHPWAKCDVKYTCIRVSGRVSAVTISQYSRELPCWDGAAEDGAEVTEFDGVSASNSNRLGTFDADALPLLFPAACMPARHQVRPRTWTGIATS